MTKEQYYTKYGITDSFIKSDLEAVIATEIEKVWELEPVQGIPQPEPNPIEEAFERGEKIRKKNWGNQTWYKKYDEKYVIDNCGDVYAISMFDFYSIKNEPEKWELYTEPTEQPANPFDKERFEAMFRAVVASGRTESYEQDFLATNICLEKLDAYYATKEGGNNE